MGILIGAAILIPVHGDTTVLWAHSPGGGADRRAYAPRVISFAAGQAAFTVVVLVLFNIIRPPAGRSGIVRIEDVAVGFAISLGVGPGVLAPRRGGAGAGEPGRGLLADRGLRGRHGGAAQRAGRRRPTRAGPRRPRPRRCTGWTTRSASTWPSGRPSGLTRSGLRGWSPGPPRCCARPVPGRALDLAARPIPALPASPLGLAGQPGAAARPGLVAQPGPAAGQCRAAPCGRGARPARTAGPRWLRPRGPSRARRSWSRTQLLCGLVRHPRRFARERHRGARRPSPGTRRTAAGCCTAPAMAISRGEPAKARDALLMLWVDEHLEMLWRLMERRPRPDGRRSHGPRDPEVSASRRSRLASRLRAAAQPGPGRLRSAGGRGQLGRVVRSRIVTSRSRRLASMSSGYSVPMSVST